MTIKQRMLLVMLVLLVMAGCVVQPTETPSLPTTEPFKSATPDIAATSAQRTLEAGGAVTPGPTGPVIVTATSPISTTVTLRPTLTPFATATATLTPTWTGSPPPSTPGESTPPPTSVSFQYIQSFAADPMEIDPGQPVTLSWETTGDSVTLWRLAATGQLSEWWDVEQSGSQVMETSELDRNAVQYMLFVTGGDVQEQTMVSVKVRCTAEWFFSPEPDVCPAEAAATTDAAYQPFERGHMFWVGVRDRIYALVQQEASRMYAAYTDPWEPGLPESDPNLSPPAGMVQPVRGFGMVWRGEVDSAVNLREALGWGTQPEAGYSARFQCDSAVKYVTCYLSGPGGEVWVLEPERSGWHILEGAVLR